MDRVIDLRAEEGPNATVLERTETGGLLGSALLHDEPLRYYLGSDEEPGYLLRNKKAGVDVSGSDVDRRIEPDADYQALALVTDVNVIFAVGRTDGDVIERVPLVQVHAAAESESGFLATNLEIETDDAGTWTFPVRGDVDAVVDYIEAAAQAWITADRLLEESEAALDDCRAALEAGEMTAAESALGDVSGDLAAARERIDGVGAAARTIVARRTTRLRTRARDLGRRLAARRAVTAHAAAHDAWDDRDYERASERYDRAVRDYRTARRLDGDVPTEDSLASRLGAARRERELLRIAPGVDADAARRAGESAPTPEAAVENWETALDRYRDAVALDWGSDERGFAIDRDEMRERAASASRSAIDARADAARRFVAAGDSIAASRGSSAARSAYERADAHLQTALDRARELLPERRAELRDLAERLDRRLADEDHSPDDEVEASPPVENPEDLLAAAEGERIDEPEAPPRGDGPATDRTATGGPAPTPSDAAGSTGKTGARRPTRADEHGETEPSPAIRPVGGGPATGRGDAGAERTVGDDANETTPVAGSGEGDDESSRERGVGSDDGTGSADEPSTADDPIPSGNDPSDADDRQAADRGSPPSPPPGGEPAGSEDGGDPDESVATSGDPTPEPPSTVAEIESALSDLDGSAFVELTADVLEENRWSTTVFAASSVTVYDVVAVRDGPDGDRMLVWAIHRPSGPAVDGTAIERCATTGERSDGADHVTLITSGSLTTTARDRADDLDVAVVDGATLAERLHEEGLQDLLVPYL